MKRILVILMGAMMILASSLAYSIQANGWRMNMSASVDGETPIMISELEFLDAGSIAVAPVDVTEADLGTTSCGWHCDSVSTNKTGSANIPFAEVPLKRNRQVGVAIDNNPASFFTTVTKSTDAEHFIVQYTIYTGVVSPPTGPRTPTLNVKTYAVTIPSGTETTSAPVGWTLEYFDFGINSWVVGDSKVPNTTDVVWSAAGRVYKVVVGPTTTFYLVDSIGTRSLVLGTDNDWSLPLTGSALTDAGTAIVDDGVLMGRRLEFSF